MSDHVAGVLQQWSTARPDLDASPMGVFGRLSRLTRLVEREQRRTFAAHGLDAASFDVLATLRRTPAPHRLTPGELVRDAMVTSGAVSMRIDRLVDRGLVERTTHPGDGRLVHVGLTGAGGDLIDRVLPDHLATERRLLSGLDAATRTALAGVLASWLVALEDGPAGS